MASIRVPHLLVIQFTFNRCSSPAEIGLDHSDERKLAVFFRMLRISASKGESIESDFSNSEVLARHSLFGFWQPKSGGVWSAGGRSAWVFEGNLGNSRSLQLKLEAHPFAEAFAEKRVEIKTSAGHHTKLNITTVGTAAVRLERPFLFPKTRLVTGDLGRASVADNVSNLRRNPKISLIILNLNKPLLSRLSAIAAASSQIPILFEILCVDNGSDPKSRRGTESIVMLPLEEWEGLQETAHLLRSPANAERLIAALNRLDHGEGKVMSVDALVARSGLR